jgi:glycosyltransferase involved in cell wall biosynthesis
MATIYEYPHIGGLSTHMSLVEKGLTANGHRVEIVSISNVNKALRILLSHLPCKVLSIFNKDIGTFWFNFMNQLLLTCLIFLKLFTKGNFDVINCQDVLSGKASLLAKRFFRIKIIFTVHGYFVRQAISNKILKKDSLISNIYLKLEKKVYSEVTLLISVDSRIKDYIVECTNTPITSRIYVLKNFIDLDEFKVDVNNKIFLRDKWGISTDKFILFCPRRLVPKNGVIYPLLSLTKLTDKDEFLLVYAGEGQERAEMERIIKQYQLEDHVLMLGDVNHINIVELYNLSDVVIVPSVNSSGVEEATSISAIEGMASGKVVIASNIGGLKELITHRYNGILVEEKDPDSLATSIIEIHSNNKIRAEIESNARETVEQQLSLDKRIKDYIAAFGSVL